MSAHPHGRQRLGGWLGGLALVLAACSSAGGTGAPDAFTGTTFATLTSDAGRRIEARSSPEAQPVRGVNSVELTVDDPGGAPLDGLAIDVVPWMSAMGHGASVKPTVTARGRGVYVLTNVDFFMPGRWELRITLTGAIEDHATLIVPIS
jgi:hypothetical protein